MNNKKYYMRVSPEVAGELDEFLSSSGCKFELISRDIPGWLYSASLSAQDVIIMRLKFPFLGFLDFTSSVVGRQIKHA